jgi:CRP-like cAMP-binding protein
VLGRNVKIDRLKAVPLFSGCSQRELREIAAIADELYVPSGTALTREGAAGHELVVIVDGAADVHRGDRKIDTVQNGDFVGEIALIADTRRNATVRTTKPTRALVLTRRDFRTLLKRVPSIQLKALDAVAARLPTD